MSRDLAVLERRAYRASNRDGIIDLMFGVSLVWIGAAWIWLPAIAGLAGMVPAILVPLVVMWRNGFVVEHGGHVRWSAPRRQRQRLGLIVAVGLGVLALAVAFAAVVALDDGASSEPLEWLAPGILAWLLAFLAAVLAVVVDAPRMLGYGAVLAAAGFAAAVFDLSPGWPLLAGGLVATASGAWMLVRFVRPADASSANAEDLGR